MNNPSSSQRVEAAPEAAPPSPLTHDGKTAELPAPPIASPVELHWKHSVMALLIAIMFVSASAELAYALVNLSAMPVFIKDTAHLDARWVGIIGTSFLLTEGALKGPMGALGDRIGRKPLILAGPILSTFTALLTPLVHNPYALVFLRVLDGIGAAALWPAVFSLIGDHVPEERRATAMSLFNVAYIFGIAVGPSLGGNVNHWMYRLLHHTMPHDAAIAHSKEASFYLAAILFALTTIAAIIFVPRFKPTSGNDGHTSGESIHLDELKIMLKRIPMTLLMTFVTFLGIGFIMLYIKTFALEPKGPFHMNEQSYGNTLVLPALLIAALSVPMGKLGDKIGKALAVKSGIGMCVVAYWLLLLFPSHLTLIALGTLIGTGFSLAFPAWMALVTEQTGSSQRGAVVGAVATAQGVGAITGSSFSAWLYPLGAISLGPLILPAHSLPFLMCGLALIGSFLLALFTLHAPRPNQAESESLE